MKNTSNKLLISGLSLAIGTSATVSGVALWALMTQDVVHADSCGNKCGSLLPACDDTVCTCGFTGGEQLCKAIVS
jgi:ABC-type nickel/cobalt efflux system permease component RcnA